MMQRDEINRPSTAALLIGLIPFLAMCFSVPLWDRIFPRVLGLPFNLFWLSLWIILSSGCMELARRLENKAKNMRDSR
jgi:hypothetical protein